MQCTKCQKVVTTRDVHKARVFAATCMQNRLVISQQLLIDIGLCKSRKQATRVIAGMEKYDLLSDFGSMPIERGRPVHLYGGPWNDREEHDFEDCERALATECARKVKAWFEVFDIWEDIPSGVTTMKEELVEGILLFASWGAVQGQCDTCVVDQLKSNLDKYFPNR